MTKGLSDLLAAFADRRVLVLGEAMLDCYLEGTTGRLCQEAPVAVVNIQQRRDFPGGAANTAVNLRALTAEPIFLSVVGSDIEGRVLADVLAEQGVSTEHLLVSPARQTLAKHRVVASSHLLVRYDQGTTTDIDEGTEHQLLERLIALHSECECVVISDYRYGAITPRIIRCLSHLQRRNPKPLIVDSKRILAFRSAAITAVKPNYDEALQMLEIAPVAEQSRAALVEAHGERLRQICNARLAAITLDVDGAMFFEAGQPPYRTYARPQPQAQAAGAGDTFLAALALSICAGASSPSAAEIASAAAAVVSAKEGTSRCTLAELEDHLCTPEKLFTCRTRLAARCELYRHQGKRIVMTGGCFDILHTGHVAYLNQAKSLGDVLIVALNTDQSVRRLKGRGRPINRQEDRLEVLAALSCVDHLILFDESTPANLIEELRPDVFVKGGDYTPQTLPEAGVVQQYGGEVQILPFVADRSTSKIIQRISKLQAKQRTIPAYFEGNGHGDDPLANGSTHFVR
jgi:D-beta-D-heptose 7-phosphate kinase/D-beta-D-heptose 1-phosphate adenosyltransferase